MGVWVPISLLHGYSLIQYFDTYLATHDQVVLRGGLAVSAASIPERPVDDWQVLMDNSFTCFTVFLQYSELGSGESIDDSNYSAHSSGFSTG